MNLHNNFSSFLTAPGIPVGLEPLLNLSSLLIEFAGFMQLESFIKTDSELLLYTSRNDIECCDCAGESTREILLTDMYGRPVMQFIRESDGCCRGSWSGGSMIVQAPAGNDIGRIVMSPGFFSSSFEIQDVSGRVLANFERNLVKLFGRSYDFTTPISGGLLLHLGTVDRAVRCASNIMKLDFNSASDYRMKVLMIAASYMITFMLRENRRS